MTAFYEGGMVGVLHSVDFSLDRPNQSSGLGVQ